MKANDINCEIIDWRITTNCNYNCEYCYAANFVEEMTEDELNKVLKSIVLSGCKTVCISGGEPLLNEKALFIIKYLFDAGISIYLSTNGTKYMEYREELEKYISKLSLPLDGYNNMTNVANGRKSNDSSLDGFDSVINILEYYKTHYHSFPIKIGTVLTKHSTNIDYITNMYNLIKDYPISYWKIYELIPEARGQINYDTLQCDENEKIIFKYKFQEFLNSISNLPFSINISERSIRNSAYFIIEPNGNVMIPKDNGNNSIEEVRVGNLVNENILNVIKKWEKEINTDNYINNSKNRFISNSNKNNHIDSINNYILCLLDDSPLYSVKHITECVNNKFQTNLTKQQIINRIDKMYNIRAIKHAMPIIDVSKFGLQVYLLNIYFRSSSTMNNSRIADVLCHNKNVAWVAECAELDPTNDNVIFRIAIFASGNNQLQKVLADLNTIFNNTLIKYELDSVPDKYVFKQRFLSESNDKDELDHNHIKLSGPFTKISKEQLSVLLAMKYLKLIDINELSRVTTFKPKKVKRIIDRLQKETIINKFQYVFDTGVLGYKCFIVFIKFNNIADRETFENHVKGIKNVSHINTLNTTSWDMDMEIQVSNAAEFNNIFENIEKTFKGIIKDSKIMIIKKEHKFRFLIDVTTKALEDSVKQKKLFSR